jgi:hypothetical protein
MWLNAGLNELGDSDRSLSIPLVTRTLAWPQYCTRIAALEHPDLSFGIPLYSDVAGEHDYVVQANGAFDQTVSGLHQAARRGIRIEVRIVLHRLTVPRLTRLAEFIFRNLPFVEHVALMGLEFVGYTARNIAELWIDPFDYQLQLTAAVRFLSERGMRVSIYNHQLCVLRPELCGMQRSRSLIGRTSIFRLARSARAETIAVGFFSGQ